MVCITPDLVCQMLKLLESHLPNETGGMLAGELVRNHQLIITHITAPGPKAIHRRFSYEPDYDYDENEIARIYRETNCVSVYLGDWHTHPFSKAYMSERDKKSLRHISQSKEARMPNPIMLIAGTSPFELCCWKYQKPTLFHERFQQIPLSLMG